MDNKYTLSLATPNPFVSAGLTAAGGFLQDLFSGQSELEKQQEEFGRIRLDLIKKLMAEKNRIPGTFKNIENDFEVGNVDYMNNLARNLSNKGLLKSGEGIGELLRAGQSERTRTLMPYKMNLPLQYDQILAQLSR